MAKKGNWIEKLSEQSQLLEHPLPGVPIIEIAGDRRVLIERHNGVIEYGPERIRIRMGFGVVCICGCNLLLRQMVKQQLIISGRIDSVQIQRRCK